jgi:hypothetical protein
MEDEIKGVTFQPWVGPRYSSSYPRLLVVGQSHYDWERRETPLPDVTREVVRDAIAHGHGPFFTNIVATCTGELPDESSRKRFWESVAFYNYIQEFVGDGPRKLHAPELWQKSHPAFGAVLACLEPQLVLVLGNANWGYLAPSETKGEPLSSGPGEYRETWYYPAGASSALAFHVKHPSAGYNFRLFAPLVAEALDRIRKFARP